MCVYTHYDPTDPAKCILEKGVSIVQVTTGCECRVTSLGCTL